MPIPGGKGVVSPSPTLGRKSPGSFLSRVGNFLLMMRQIEFYFQPIRMILEFSSLAGYWIISPFVL